MKNSTPNTPAIPCGAVRLVDSLERDSLQKNLSSHRLKETRLMRFVIRQCSSCTFLIIVGLSGMLIGCDWKSPNDSPAGESKQPRKVFALGRLEPAGGIISISAIPGERLKVLDPDVFENRLAPKNGVLGLLASYDVGKAQLAALIKKQDLANKKRDHELEVVEAQKAQAEAAEAQALAKQKEVDLLEGKLAVLEVASKLATQEYDQLAILYSSDPELVTEHQLAKQQNEMDLAVQEHKIASESYCLSKEAADKAVDAAQANVTVAKKSLDQLREGFDSQAVAQEIEVAKETLKRSVLLVPNVSADDLPDVMNIKCIEDHDPIVQEKASDDRPYTVLKTFLRPGEFITQTPIVQLGDLRKMVCIAEVYEADVKELRDKQLVTIRSPSFSPPFADGKMDPETKIRPGGMQGIVTRIGRMIAPPGLTNRNPLAPADRSVVEVRIEIQDKNAILHASTLVGLKVTVEFEAQTGSGTGTNKSRNDGDLAQ